MLLGVASCVPQRTPEVDATVSLANAAGLPITFSAVGDFELLLVRNKSAGAAESLTALRVYLAGDGTPWLGNRVARNPGPFEPLAIELMLRDPTPAVYLGRPCYHRQSPVCRPSLWSFERFGPRVVEAMATALRALSRNAQGARLTLVGYSGGGVLAALLAQEVAAVDTLVTIAAPLDTAAWTALHDYTPLLGSVNPADRLPLRAEVQQLHLQGADDKEVPPEITQRYLARQPGARRQVLRGQTHRCCWLERWPQLLAEPAQRGP